MNIKHSTRAEDANVFAHGQNTGIKKCERRNTPYLTMTEIWTVIKSNIGPGHRYVTHKTLKL